VYCDQNPGRHFQNSWPWEVRALKPQTCHYSINWGAQLCNHEKNNTKIQTWPLYSLFWSKTLCKKFKIFGYGKLTFEHGKQKAMLPFGRDIKMAKYIQNSKNNFLCKKFIIIMSCTGYICFVMLYCIALPTRVLFAIKIIIIIIIKMSYAYHQYNS
jgi:hypothetical protein